ncbi:hypothetical protein LINGRAHAP2_LOCUS10514 [Linum grandiflorum]
MVTSSLTSSVQSLSSSRT